MLRIEDQIENSTAMIKTADYIESQIRKINSDDGGVADRFVEIAKEAVEKMRGKVGTKIKLTIRRANEKPFDVTLKREEIKIQSVKSDIKAKDIAYIRISSFNDGSDATIKKEFAKMQKKTKKTR